MAAVAVKLPIAVAANMAVVHRQRLNEAIAAGFYPCAPATVKGAARWFDLNDLLTLWVYGQLTEEGMHPRYAGRVACGLRHLLANHPGADEVVHVKTTADQYWRRGEDFSLQDGKIDGAFVLSARRWFLKHGRELLLFEIGESPTQE